MTWVCDHCDSAMEELEENEDWKRIHCPNCGTERYVDGDNQYINEQAKPDAMHRALQSLIKWTLKHSAM